MISVERGRLPAPEQPNVLQRLVNDNFLPSASKLVFHEKCRPDLGSDHIVFYQKVWSVPLQLSDIASELPGTSIYLPLYGEFDGHWYDGPIFRVFSNTKILSFLAQGFPGRLILPIESSMAAVDDLPQSLVSDRDLLNSAVSIARELSEGFSQLELAVSIKDFSIETMVALVLLKKACPERNLVATHGLDYKSWPSEMKRFCQNLGMSQYEYEISSKIDFFQLSSLISAIQPMSHVLARTINDRSDVVPRNLI